MGTLVSIFRALIISLASKLAKLLCSEVGHSWSQMVDELTSLTSNLFGFSCHYFEPIKAHETIYISLKVVSQTLFSGGSTKCSASYM